MNILCLDPSGLYPEVCNALWKKGDTIKYYTSFEADLKFDWFAIGLGFEHLEKIKFPADYYEWSELIFAPDVVGQDTVSFLKKIYPKKSVWGSGDFSKAELNRWGLKKILKDIDIKFARSERIIGVDKLKDYFILNKDKFIKISTFRNDIESFYAKDGNSIDLKLDEISASYGPFKNKTEFIVEDCIESDVEIGADLISYGDDYQRPFLYGYECGKKFYFSRCSEELPKLLKDVMDKFKPLLKKLDYRGGISTEIKVTDKNTSYFLDLTARLANPLCVLYGEHIKNWREVVYNTGLGKECRLDIRHKYLGCFFLNSYHGINHWIKIDVDKKDREFIKFVVVGENDGQFYSIKGTEKIAVVIAGGNTIQEVIDILKKYSERVNADSLEKGAIHEIDKITDIIASGKRMGLEF